MITIYVQMLQRSLGPQMGDQANEYIRHVVAGAGRISRLIDGLLQFSRIGEIDTALPTAVEAEAALKEALDDLQMTIGETGAEISYDHLPRVMAAQTQLCQLFENLIANGLKYCKPNERPRIHISAKRKDGLWVFAVQDNGIGIAQKHQMQVFQPFKRLHGAEIPGSGIGLATCKRIVERYEGQIWVVSEEGQGSTFYFSLHPAEAAVHSG